MRKSSNLKQYVAITPKSNTRIYQRPFFVSIDLDTNNCVYFNNKKAAFARQLTELHEFDTAKDAIAYAWTNGAQYVCFMGTMEIIWVRDDPHLDWSPEH